MAAERDDERLMLMVVDVDGHDGDGADT